MSKKAIDFNFSSADEAWGLVAHIVNNKLQIVSLLIDLQAEEMAEEDDKERMGRAILQATKELALVQLRLRELGLVKESSLVEELMDMFIGLRFDPTKDNVKKLLNRHREANPRAIPGE